MLDVCYVLIAKNWTSSLVQKSNLIILLAKGDGAIKPYTYSDTESFFYVSQMKYLRRILNSIAGLRVNIKINFTKIFGSPCCVLQRCEVLRDIIQTKYLFILIYGLKCFHLLETKKNNVKMAFNCVIRRLFELSSLKLVLLRHINHMLSSIPCNILIDERKFLLLI